ncbi:hypothetical protein D9M68_679630 [compost metagenome]
MVLLDKGLRQREPQAGAAIASRHKREKDAVLDRVWYARPVVDDMQFQCQAIALLAKRDLPTHTGLENDLRLTRRDAFGQRLRRVVRDVEHGLDELLAVTAKLGNGSVVVAHHAQPLGELGQYERTHPLANLVNVHVTHHVRSAVRREQAINQRLQPISLVDDDLCVFDEFARIQLHLKQLRGSANPAQRILDLVREVANELLVGLGLVDQALLALLSGLLLQRQQLHHYLTLALGLGHHHMHRQGFMAHALEPGVVAQGGKFVAPGATECVLQ